jgi:hypothetical protein
MKSKLTIFFTLLIIFSSRGYSQTDTTFGWAPLAVISFNLSQLTLSNWTQGGTNSLTWTGIGKGGVRYKNIDWTWGNDLKLAYGRTKIGGEDFRTNDNEFYFESVISRNTVWAIDPYFSNTIRSALTTGYSYRTDPPVEIANFFDPGYITQSIGFTYDRIPGFKTRLGFALQEIFTNKFTQYTDDTTTAEVERFKLETGLESVTSFDYTLAENLIVQSKLRLFSRYESLDVWDVRWDNTLTAKINNFVNVNFSYLFVYEKAQSLTAQMKQALQLGFVYALL